jgi:hypothetical protein
MKTLEVESPIKNVIKLEGVSRSGFVGSFHNDPDMRSRNMPNVLMQPSQLFTSVSLSHYRVARPKLSTD